MQNNYKEIKSFLPDYYDEFIETQAYLKALGYQLDLAEESNQRVLLNNFINLADAQTIERLERYLYLPVDRAKPLEDRKRLVASFFVGLGKMSGTKIKEIVYQFTGTESEVEFKDSSIFVKIQRGSNESLYLVDVITVLSRRLPAHLSFRLNVFTNRKGKNIHGFSIRQNQSLKISSEFKPITTTKVINRGMGIRTNANTILSFKNNFESIPTNNNLRVGKCLRFSSRLVIEEVS